MVEQRNNFSNKFDDFQALIDELKNQSLITRQCLEQFEVQMVKQAKVMAEQAKVKAYQAKVKVEQAKIKAEQAKIRVDQAKVSVEE